MQARSEKVAGIMASDPGAAAAVGKAFGRRQARAVGEALRGALVPKGGGTDEGTGSGSGR